MKTKGTNDEVPAKRMRTNPDGNPGSLSISHQSSPLNSLGSMPPNHKSDVKMTDKKQLYMGTNSQKKSS